VAKLTVKAGSTSKRIAIFVTDASSTVGAGLSGLVFNSLGLTAYYWREDAGDVGGTAISLVTATRGSYTSSGFIEKDATNLPGCYEVGVPNAVFAAGAAWAVLVIKGASNMVPVTIEIELETSKAADAVNILEGDESIDTTTDPTQYQQVIELKGTSTELVRKKLYKTDGVTKIAADSDIVGQRSET